jgi:hypothetical protein
LVEALARVDAVREAEDGLRVGVVVLERDLDLDVDPDLTVARRLMIEALTLEVDRRVERVAGAVHVLDERDDAALVVEVVRLGGALVLDHDANAGVQERELPEPLRQRVEAELDRLEDRRIGMERDACAGLVGRADAVEISIGDAQLVALLPDLSVPADLELEVIRECVDAGDADSVETARDLVGLVGELAAGVERRHHDLRGGAALLLVQVHGDAATVVLDGDRVVAVDDDPDQVAEASDRLVDRVVHHLVDQVVEPRRAGGADVHGRPLADRLQPLQDLDGSSIVLAQAPLLEPLPARAVGVTHKPRSRRRSLEAAGPAARHAARASSPTAESLAERGPQNRETVTHRGSPGYRNFAPLAPPGGLWEPTCRASRPCRRSPYRRIGATTAIWSGSSAGRMTAAVSSSTSSMATSLAFMAASASWM